MPTQVGTLILMPATEYTEWLRFRFELDSVADIQPWGEPGRASLHWFGLTSGRYWIETPIGEVLRYTTEIQRRWNHPFQYVDYQVARWFEDLEDCLPFALEQVPNDIAGIVSDPVWLANAQRWREQEGDSVEMDSRWDLYDSAIGWWHERTIDTSHLGFGPLFWFWRTDDEVHFRWATENNEDRGTAVFLHPDGYIKMRSADFQDAAYGFCEELLAAMKGRVDQIRRDGWNRWDCRLDVDELVTEQLSRERRFAVQRSQSPATDWQRVRTQLKELAAQVTHS